VHYYTTIQSKSTLRLVLVELISHNHCIVVLINLKRSPISIQITTLHMAIFTYIHNIQLLLRYFLKWPGMIVKSLATTTTNASWWDDVLWSNWPSANIPSYSSRLKLLIEASEEMLTILRARHLCCFHFQFRQRYPERKTEYTPASVLVLSRSHECWCRGAVVSAPCRQRFSNQANLQQEIRIMVYALSAFVQWSFFFKKKHASGQWLPEKKNGVSNNFFWKT